MGNSVRQFTVEARAGAVTIHGSQQDFSGAARFGFPRPVDGISAGGRSPALGKGFPTPLATAALCVDGNDNRLGAEALRDLRDQCWIGESGGVDADLVGTGGENSGCFF